MAEGRRSAPRCVLRVPEPRDAEPLHALFDDPAVMRYVGDGTVRDLGYYRAFVEGHRGRSSTPRACASTWWSTTASRRASPAPSGGSTRGGRRGGWRSAGGWGGPSPSIRLARRLGMTLGARHEVSGRELTAGADPGHPGRSVLEYRVEL
jgi:hypothetical protein